MGRKEEVMIKRGLLILLTSSFIFTGCGSVQEEAIDIVDLKPFVMDEPEACNIGSITVYESDGEVRNTYQGPIDILNDGKNGDEIEIVINLP